MTDTDRAANARRRQWFQDRARALQIAREGSRLVVGRMDTGALWEAAARALLDLEEGLSGRALPREMAACQDALAAVLELRTRGTQLQLPLEDGGVPL